MNWNEYKELAARTEALRPDLPMPVGSFRLMHAAAGLVTETQELADFVNAANLCEELGDCSWYFPIFVELLEQEDAGFSMERLLACGPDLGLQTFESCIQTMQRQAAELVDLSIKRHIVYGKPMEPATFSAVGGALALFIEAWVHACRAKGFSPEAAMEANIVKLEKRFPEKMFTQQRVFNRDTTAELSHMPAPVPEPIGFTMPNELAALDVLTFEAYKVLLRNEMTEQEGRACTAAMAGALATQYGDAGAHCVKEGFKACYIKVFTDPSWLEDSYQLYQMLYPVGWTVDAVLTNLRRAGKP